VIQVSLQTTKVKSPLGMVNYLTKDPRIYLGTNNLTMGKYIAKHRNTGNETITVEECLSTEAKQKFQSFNSLVCFCCIVWIEFIRQYFFRDFCTFWWCQFLSTIPNNPRAFCCSINRTPVNRKKVICENKLLRTMKQKMLNRVEGYAIKTTKVKSPLGMVNYLTKDPRIYLGTNNLTMGK
jgi:hypothetical protein